MHISLRPNEKIYINGAVLKVDRKVSIELMNDAVFLLEAHVMLEEKATTPLRKLYFIVQLMLMEPSDSDAKKIMFNLQGLSIAGHCRDASILAGLAAVSDLVVKGRVFEALKLIRTMIPLEDRLLLDDPASPGGSASRRQDIDPVASRAPAPRSSGSRVTFPQRRVSLDVAAGWS